jgi:hypothetical protein
MPVRDGTLSRRVPPDLHSISPPDMNHLTTYTTSPQHCPHSCRNEHHQWSPRSSRADGHLSKPPKSSSAGSPPPSQRILPPPTTSAPMRISRLTQATFPSTFKTMIQALYLQPYKGNFPRCQSTAYLRHTCYSIRARYM